MLCVELTKPRAVRARADYALARRGRRSCDSLGWALGQGLDLDPWTHGHRDELLPLGGRSCILVRLDQMPDPGLKRAHVDHHSGERDDKKRYDDARHLEFLQSIRDIATSVPRIELAQAAWAFHSGRFDPVDRMKMGRGASLSSPHVQTRGHSRQVNRVSMHAETSPIGSPGRDTQTCYQRSMSGAFWYVPRGCGTIRHRIDNPCAVIPYEIRAGDGTENAQQSSERSTIGGVHEPHQHNRCRSRLLRSR